MRNILEKNYNDLGKELLTVYSLINNKPVPDELTPFKSWFIKYLEEQKSALDKCLTLLNFNEESIFPEILNLIQTITRDIRKIGVKYFPPIFRYEDIDLFCLKFLKWLHYSHEQSKNTAFAISDGKFAIYPNIELPIIYFLPLTARQNLIYFPLFFHEFSHYLYSFHYDEMKALATSLQNQIKKLLVLPIQQNDTWFEQQKIKNQKIAEVWFDWIQEIFCDAVGLHIGGPSFLKSFSLYFRMMGRDEFYLPEKKIGRTNHPPSWVRVKLLSQRARVYGLNQEAEQLDYEWKQISKYLKVKDDFYGYYSKQFDPAIFETIDEMLKIAKPVKFSQSALDNDIYEPDKDNFIKLVNVAWLKYEANFEKYIEWENELLIELNIINFQSL